MHARDPACIDMLAQRGRMVIHSRQKRTRHSDVMTFPDRVRLPLTFDPALLRKDLESLSGVEWIDHFVTQNYEGNWTVLPLRGPAGAMHPVMMIYADPSATAFADAPALVHTAYFRKV